MDQQDFIMLNFNQPSTNAGKNVTALIDVNASGEITNAEIMDGSACLVGDSFNVVGVATTSGHTVGVVSVTQIYNNIGDVIRLNNVSHHHNSTDDYNQLYRITGITAGDPYTVEVSSASTVSSPLVGSASGIGITLATPAFYYEVGPSIDVQTLDYNQVTGVGIITCTKAHGFFVDNRVHVCGADQRSLQWRVCH